VVLCGYGGVYGLVCLLGWSEVLGLGKRKRDWRRLMGDSGLVVLSSVFSSFWGCMMGPGRTLFQSGLGG
jgi:hypothetical protein